MTFCGGLVDESRPHGSFPVEGKDEWDADDDVVVVCFICWDKRDDGCNVGSFGGEGGSDVEVIP